jgi:hypothetical protein
MRVSLTRDRLLNSAVRFLFLAIFLLVSFACQRTQRPFAGENEPPADTPNYSVKANPNGGVVPLDK